MAGRKPLPTHLKMVRGTLQKCRMNPDEPTPDPEIPDAPPHLSPEAREEWERLALELYELGILSTIDRAALAAYCQAYGRWVEAEEQLRNIDGTMKLTETTSNGNIIQNPLVGIANKSLELMHKYLTEFGMSPSSRTRLGIRDYSRKDTDEFGNTRLVKRANAKRTSLPLYLHPSRLDSVREILARMHGLPALWLGDDNEGIGSYQSLTVWGWLEDWNATVIGPNEISMTIDIQGLK